MEKESLAISTVYQSGVRMAICHNAQYLNTSDLSRSSNSGSRESLPKSNILGPPSMLRTLSP